MADDAAIQSLDEDLGMRLLTDADIPETMDGMVQIVGQLFGHGANQMLRACWNIGKCARALQINAGTRYGTNAVGQLAGRINRSERLIHDMLRFYNQHTDPEGVKTLGIEWSAARIIGQVKDDTARIELETRAQDENLTVRDLRAIVRTDRPVVAPPPPDEDVGTDTGAAGPEMATPVVYLTDLRRQMEQQLGELQEEVGQKPDYLHIAEDDEQTSDEDFEEIKRLARCIAEVATRHIQFLQQNLVTMETWADEMEADSDSKPKTASAKKGN